MNIPPRPSRQRTSAADLQTPGASAVDTVEGPTAGASDTDTADGPTVHALDTDTVDRPTADASATDTADRLHSAAIHLLRRLRVHDAAAGLTASRLSALSVVVFAGPLRIGDLAAAEQVRPPSMTRTVADLERAGLVRRFHDRSDGRAQLVESTARGRTLLDEGRTRRVAALAREVAALPEGDRAVLGRAADLLERLSMPSDHPLQEGRGPRPDGSVNT